MINFKKIIAYNSIQDIKEYYTSNNCDLIISAYKDSIDSIKKDNNNINIISMGQITEGIFESWNNKELEYENILSLRKFLQEEKCENLVKRFEKSIDSVYSDIKTCKELSIYPEDYEKFIETDEDVIFLNLMKKVYMEDNFIDYDIKLYNYKKNIEIFKNDFINLINEILEIDSCKNMEFKKIIIQGFYYITPIQRMLIDLISRCGIEVIPLICFNPSYDKVNKIIHKTFNNIQSIENLYKPKHNEKDISDIFGDLLDNRRIDSYKDEVKLNIEFNIYEDLNAYNKDILNSDQYIFATSRRDLLNRISIFGGNLNNSKKISIKYYPIGIFLKDIYKTWNKNRKDILLDIDVLYRLFEVSILKLDHKNSKNYLYDLLLISNYFIDCETLKEWIERANLLKENIVNCKYDKLKRYYAPFTINLSRLQDIIDYLKQIKDITDILFNKDDFEIDMNMHLKNLQYVVEKNIYDTEDKDNLMAYELLKKIKDILICRERQVRVNNTYLHDAINRYINTIEDEGELDVNIFPLDSVESSYGSKNDKIFICDFDRDSFPNIKKVETTWLSTTKLRNLMNYKDDEIEKDLIYRNLILIEEKDIISRYVFWLMLKIPKYKIISRLKNNDKDTEHFYESILVDIGVNRINKEFNNNKPKYNLNDVDLSKYILLENQQRNFKNEKRNNLFRYCPLRAFLYRVNSNKECYTDNFRIEHYMPTLFESIVKDENNPSQRKREIINLLDLLPQYPKVQKDTMMYSALKNCKMSKEEINLNAHIHYSVNVFEEYRNLKQYIKYEEQINDDKEIIKFICNQVIPIANGNENTCKFCPNIDKCIAKIPPQINI